MTQGIPTKAYWMGEDIDTLPAERLREIVRHLGRELEATRAATRSVIEINRLAREAISRNR